MEEAPLCYTAHLPTSHIGIIGSTEQELLASAADPMPILMKLSKIPNGAIALARAMSEVLDTLFPTVLYLQKCAQA